MKTNYNWAAAAGEFEVKPETKTIIFKGAPTTFTDAQTGKENVGDSFGLLLSDQKLSEGQLSMEVQFEKIDDRSTCQIVFYHDSMTSNNISAGISSAGTGDNQVMFAIQSYLEKKYNFYTSSGSHKNLKPNQSYKIMVQVKGTQVILQIDGVEVLSYILPINFQQGQAGIMSLNQSKITIKNFTVEQEKPKIFMIMEFTDKYKEIYEEAIKEVISDAKQDLEIIKADEIYGPGIIISDIFDKINKSKLIIAEVTPKNANVFYEIGYAQALKKPTILIAEQDTILPFDIKAFRVLFYKDTIAGKRSLQTELKKHIDNILSSQTLL